MLIGIKLKRVKIVDVQPKLKKITIISFSISMWNDERHVYNNLETRKPPTSKFPGNQIIIRRREGFNHYYQARIHQKILPTSISSNFNAPKNTAKFI